MDSVILSAHQWLVNLVGKPTLWWGRQVLICYAVVGALHMVLWWAEMNWQARGTNLLVDLFLLFLMRHNTRSEVKWRLQVSVPFIRYMFLLLLSVALYYAITSDEGRYTTGALMIALLVSFEYFRACLEPPPPKPRTKFSVNPT